MAEPDTSYIPGERRQSNAPPGTIKRPPRRSNRVGVEFKPIHPQWLAVMDATEKKYGLPEGVLLTLYGYENGGGYDLGRMRGGSANGLFQFTDEARRQWGIRPEDRNNPAVMIEAAAKNLRYNANIYKKEYGQGQDIPTDPRYIPYWVALHQFGSGNGPRIVHASLHGSGHMPATDVMIKGSKPGANYAALTNNGISGGSSVDGLIQHIIQRAQPWFDSGIKLRGTGTEPQTTQAGETPPRPPGEVGGVKLEGGSTAQGVSPRLLKAAAGGAQLALPAGYTLRASSGVRHGPGANPNSQHYRGHAVDFKIITPDGEEIPNKGVDRTGLYTKLARGIKTWVRENDPSYERYLGWGGAFETKRGSGTADIMHIDEGGSRGQLRPNAQFGRLPLLADNERNAPASTTIPKKYDFTDPQAKPKGDSTSASAEPAQTAPPPQLPPMKPSEAMHGDGSRDPFAWAMRGIPQQPPVVESKGYGGYQPSQQLAATRALGGAHNVPLPEARPDNANAIPPAQVQLPQPRPDIANALPPSDVKLPLARPLEADQPPITMGWGGNVVPPASPPPVVREDAPLEGGPDWTKEVGVVKYDQPKDLTLPMLGGDPQAVPYLDNPHNPNAPTPDLDVPLPIPDPDAPTTQSPPTPTPTPEQAPDVANIYDIPPAQPWPNPNAASSIPTTAQLEGDSTSAAASIAPVPPQQHVLQQTPGKVGWPEPPVAKPDTEELKVGWGPDAKPVIKDGDTKVEYGSTLPSVKQVADAIFSGRIGHDWPIDYSGMLPDKDTVTNTVKKLIPDVGKAGDEFATQKSASDERVKLYEKAVKDWVAARAGDVKDVAGSVKDAAVDWYYGPKSVKTEAVGIHAKPTAPDTSSTKPNAATTKTTVPTAPPIADPGGPQFKQPPLLLVPNSKKKAAAPPPFTIGAPAAGGTTTTATPPMKNRIPDPDHPGQWLYKTPEEMKLLEHPDT